VDSRALVSFVQRDDLSKCLWDIAENKTSITSLILLILPSPPPLSLSLSLPLSLSLLLHLRERLLEEINNSTSTHLR